MLAKPQRSVKPVNVLGCGIAKETLNTHISSSQQAAPKRPRSIDGDLFADFCARVAYPELVGYDTEPGLMSRDDDPELWAKQKRQEQAEELFFKT